MQFGRLHPKHHGKDHGIRSGDHGAPQPRLGLTLIAASLCIFVVQLDFLALNLALPRMASELGTTTTDLQWVISGYMLALAAALIPGGRLGDILGRKRMLLIGLALFGICSLAAGLSSEPSIVIVMRIAQGVGAGVLFPLAIAVLTDAYPQDRTMRAIGNAYGIGAVALALGPVFGGGVTELLSWRIVLLFNVPTCAVALAVVVAGVRESRDGTVPRSIDLPGVLTVALGIAAVTYAVDRSTSWPAGRAVGIAAAGVLLLVAFVLRERVARWPLVALDLFRNKPYVVITLMSTVANVSFAVAMYGVTINLQQVDGYSPLTAGLVFLAASVSAGVAAPLSGPLGERFDVPRTMAATTGVGAVGLFIASFGGGLWTYLPGLALTGFGYGMGWTMGSVGTQVVVPAERAGQASGVTLAVVIGVAGLCVAASATLIEVRAADEGLGRSVEGLLRWVAVGSAVAAAALGLLAARLMPRATAPAD
ncbi:MFS transporter [Streptomyces sp. HNM0663]|uniref:MFS transporter n=1 Tax=Streptomyces chengmaiensis TaxID=3040919 RepID=A0ABT6HH73_9ACTN|nr:MFS transporter [Streptomyces chengmaiensis]MDH2387936.1 MFS transporter [Streptomyces chengmaiensis]